MKTIHSFDIDLGNIKGAISALDELSAISDKAKGALSSLNLDGKAIAENASQATDSMSKLREMTLKTKGAFAQLGHNIRAIATNFMSKFTSVLKTGLGLVGALSGAVMGVFAMANGTGKTVTEGTLNGLSWAEQRALENANDETGYNVNLNTIAKTIAAPDVQALEQNAFLKDAGIDVLSYKPGESYKAYNDISKKMSEIYGEMTKGLSGEAKAVKGEEFKARYGQSLEQLLGTDWQSALMAEQSGVMNRHRERYGKTLDRYSGVDVNALLKGERALDDFSETFKAFAMSLSSKILPPLTKTLKNFTGWVSKSYTKLEKGGLFDKVGEVVARVFGAIGQIVTTIAEAFNSATGHTVLEAIKGVLEFVANLAELIADIVTGNWTGVVSKGKEMGGQVKTFAKGVTDIASDIASDAVDGAVSLWQKGKDWLFDKKDEPDTKQVTPAIVTEGQKPTTISDVTQTSTTNNTVNNNANNKLNQQLNININLDGKKVATTKQAIATDLSSGLINKGRQVNQQSEAMF